MCSGTISALHALATLIANTHGSLVRNPVFWTRLVGYGYVRTWLLDKQGGDLGFGTRRLAVARLLQAAGDPQIDAHLNEYPSLFDGVLKQGL